jgi:hypothetical protein
MTFPTIISTIQKNSRETVRVALDEFRGVQLIDIRVVVDGHSGVPVPTKKGVNLKIELLPELVAALQAAELEARRLGLLTEPARAVA